MSTKIWTAYRIRRGYKMWDVLRDIQTTADRRVEQLLTKSYKALMKGYAEDRKVRQEIQAILKDRKKPKVLSPLDAGHVVRMLFKEQRGHFERSVHDWTACVTIRQSGRSILLIPHTGSATSTVYKFLDKRTALEDYHYQNQTDRPDNITAAAWRARARTWEPCLDTDATWRFRLKLSSVEDDYDLMRLCPAFKPKGPFAKQLREHLKL